VNSPPRRPEARLGTVLDGKYELEEVLGRGASGAVYAAVHRFTERRVAVKVMHPHLLDSREHVERFLREARIAGAVNHPNVAALLDAGRVEQGAPYIVTELLEGEDLYRRLKRGPIERDVALSIVRSLLAGLAAVHAAGIIHRDVKPENVFLAGAEPPGLDVSRVTVKLLDFGIAKRPFSATSLNLTSPDRTVGTPLYMSPEQIRGKPLDGRSDLWSVGVLLHELLTGFPPFTESNPTVLLRRVILERPPSIAERIGGLPAHLVLAIDKALEKEPQDRWSSASDMAVALRA
jgi:serine/threonine-protein kinase